MDITQFFVFVIYFSSLLSMSFLLLALIAGAQKKASNFIVLISVLLAWLLPQFIAQFVFSSNQEVSDVLIRISIFLAGFVTPALTLFTRQVLKVKKTVLLNILSLVTPILSIFSLLPISHLSINVSRAGIAVTSNSPFYSALAIITLASFLVAALTIRNRETKSKDLHAKRALRALKNGLLIATGFNLVGAILLAEFEWSQVLTPLSMATMTGVIYVAIFKHKLFDIRLLVARAVAYTLLLSTIVGLYSLVVFGIANRVLGTESVFAQQVVPIVAAIFLVFTAPYFKRLFDRITNKFFYQDAYDPQALLDDLNKVLIGNIELTILLRQATGVIQEHLKSQTCSVVVREAGEATLRAVGTSPQHPSAVDMLVIRRGLHKLGQKIVVTDDLGQHYSKLKHALTANNISVIVPLSSVYKSDEEALAYLMLGPKQSGNIYSKQDYRIIEIIADEMVIAIQNALRFEEIQGFAATLQQKVDEATAKLKRTNDKLKEMDETKDEFISMASHQLRTPLTSVKGYLSMVLEGDMGKVNPKQEKLLDQAFISSQRMVYLIADLLNVSRLKTGKFVIMSAPANLADIVEGELNQLNEVAKGKKVKIVYKKPKNFPSLLLDETKIRQVVMNFADNAIYYTQAGGRVEIEVKEDKNNIYFTVKDNGLGIPKEEQKNLFTKFYRASNARKVRPDGTGLGLFMAKRVVAAQGGSILFESTEGKGSIFGFSFSKAKLALDQQKPQGSADPIAS